ncbi:MAG: ATP-binding cassette domain-containing protein, partial [Acidaminococcales bacterium]|nr:ATP-binding cassette domain-containing protein [Acidaminococcales bacterium]
MGNVLKIENLRKSFGGHTVINDISLSVKRGSLIGIIGPNGAGKSTLLNCILGMLRADRGNIYFNNENITHLKIY